MSARFDHRAFASATDPLRQSDLKDLAGEFGCAKRWRYKKQEQAEGKTFVAERLRGRSVLGTAIHHVIERVLTAFPEVRPLRLSEDKIRTGFNEEWELARAPEGEPLPVDWGPSQNAESEHEAAVTMLHRLFTTDQLASKVARVIGLEVPFLVDLGEYTASGTIDLVGEGRDGELVLLDWKTGERLMCGIEREHGYQFGLYARALEVGTLWPGTERETALGRFPDAIYLAHLRDLLPYKRRTTKVVSDAAEAAFWGVEPGTRIEISPPGQEREEPSKRRRIPTVEVVGHQRGPVFYPCPRGPEDIRRLTVGGRTLVRQVRLGIFPERITEGCGRCPFKTRCFADGYAPEAEEEKHINRALRGLDDYDGFGDDLAA